MPQKRRPTDERNQIVERLREFLRFNYVTAKELSRRLGVRDGTVYSWLGDEFRPRDPAKIAAFLDSLPVEATSGTAPAGYQYKPYPTPPKRARPCPFCRQARGEIQKVRGGFLGVCPNCGATGPKREGHDEALRAWNGRSYSWAKQRGF
jgi:hypothetical protein